MAKKPATATPATEAPDAKAPPAPKTIKVLVAEPKLRGSRAARWDLLTKAGDAATLATLLKDGGWKQSAAGTLRWAVKAKLVSLD